MDHNPPARPAPIGELKMTTVWKWTVAFLLAAALSTGAYAKGKTHRVALQVNQNDKALMNLVLNNVKNLQSYYEKKGDKAIIEIVAYGPGLHMFREDTSPVKDRIATMGLEMPDLKFSACSNTHENMGNQDGKPVKLVSEAEMVPSGIVQLVTLQQKGYIYVRP